MRKMKNIIRFSALAAVIIGASACTDLSETVYDQVMTNNYAAILISSNLGSRPILQDTSNSIIY